MPQKSTMRLTKRTVDALSVERGDGVFWDRDLSGFGVRVYASGRRIYVVQKRGPSGRLKRVSLGESTKVTAEEARRQAAEVIDRLKRGEEAFPEPPAPEPTVAELAERYMKAHVEVNCRPGTVETFGRVVRLYILPELGHLRLSEVERSHVAALHHKMRDKPYQANQTRNVLAKMFKLAEAWGMTPPRRNPCLSIRRYKEYRRERFLSHEELLRLARVLDEAETDGSVFPTAVPAIRLLLLTGCRRNEILTLKWDDIDRKAGELRLSDSKTGARRVQLTPAVEWVLDRIPRIEGNPWVITGQNPGDRLKNLDMIWQRIRARAGLHDVRIHDCRHSYASRALALGEGIPVISKLLGHRRFSTKACSQSLPRYVIENRDLSDSGAVSTDRALLVRQEPRGVQAPLCG